MAVMHRKKPRLSKKVQDNETGFCYSCSAKIFSQFPTAVFLFAFIFIWSSCSTIISSDVVHVCVSSRKLNNLYCLSAGAQPSLQLPFAVLNDSSTPSAVVESEASVKASVSIVQAGDDHIEASGAEERKDVKATDSSEIQVVKEGGSLEDNVAIAKEGSVDVEANNAGERKDVKASESSEASFQAVKEGGNVEANGTEERKDVKATDFAGEDLLQVVKEGGDVDGNGGEERTNESFEASFDVEENLRVQRSWRSDSSQATCEGRGVYVYELPSKFNKDLMAQCSDMNGGANMCKYFTNNGLGERMEGLGRGWYHTHQYSLEPIFHSRVLKHPCRVYNQNEAKLFYVPYYGGLDILRWHFKNVTNDVKDSLALGVLRWLEMQGSWYKNLGKDHVFVLGKIAWDFRRLDTTSWGTRFLELDEMQNPVKLMIERSPWQVNDIGIPHPTYFHPQSDDDIVSWQTKVITSDRRSVVSFAGADRPGSTETIRSVLIQQCVSVNDNQCKLLNCKAHQCDRPESIVELFLESEFCLQPPGDSPTRKSVFDSLVAGCIPVMFDPFTAYYQYPWHLPEDREKYSVFIDKEDVKNGSTNVVERLMRIPAKERENMRRYIVYELLPGLVYGDSDSKFDKFQDSFSITMNNLLERVNRLSEL